jgi:hypothetical protein
VQLGVWQADRLVGYARALTDGRFRALIDDVVVDEAQRGSGIGSEIMRRLVGYVTRVDEVFLLADDRNVFILFALGICAQQGQMPLLAELLIDVIVCFELPTAVRARSPERLLWAQERAN